MSRTSLQLINLSNDSTHRNIVIFQKNTSAEEGQPCVAWHVIAGTRPGSLHHFSYTSELNLSAGNAYDHSANAVPVQPGNCYRVARAGEGFIFEETGMASALLGEVELYNNLDEVSVHANMFKDGKLLAVSGPVRPGQTTCFSFRDKIMMGVLPFVEQGDLINFDMAAKSACEIDLRNVESADIVLRDGKPGELPFVFSLENVTQRGQTV